MPSRTKAFSDSLLPDQVQKQIERGDLAASLDRQGVSLESPWRATRMALGASGVARFVAGEILVVAPSVLLIVAALLQLRWLAFAWVPVIGLAWWSRDGRASSLGFVGSLVVPFGMASLLATMEQSLVTVLGGFCVPWTWYVGMLTRAEQIGAVVDRLANNLELYARLRVAGFVKGPEHADLHVTVHRSDQIEPR